MLEVSVLFDGKNSLVLRGKRNDKLFAKVIHGEKIYDQYYLCSVPAALYDLQTSSGLLLNASL